MKLESAKAWARPITTYTFVFGWLATIVVTLVLWAMDIAKTSEVSGLLIALVAGGSAPVTTYTYGRTKEKVEGVDTFTDEFNAGPEDTQ